MSAKWWKPRKNRPKQPGKKPKSRLKLPIRTSLSMNGATAISQKESNYNAGIPMSAWAEGDLRIVSVCALARRRDQSEALQRDKITSSKDAFRLFCNAMNIAKISEGRVTGTVVDPKKVFKIALDHHASSIILGHNHPSGNVNPSDQDSIITQKLIQAGKLIEIMVLDHIILGQEQYYSFADEGKI